MQSHPPSICKVLCFTGGAFVIKGLPKGGEFVTYEFLAFCYSKEGKLKYNIINIRYLMQSSLFYWSIIAFTEH